MSDEIRVFVVGELNTNCYAYISNDKALVVDPGANGAAIADALNDVKVISIVATHCHHDHVCGISALQKATGAPWYIGAADCDAAMHALARSVHATPASIAAGTLEDPPAPDTTLKEGDELVVGTAKFHIVDAPGHTPGGIILIGDGTAKNVAFMGDTLFAGSCGRTDLKGGNAQALAATLNRLKTSIPPTTTLLCGHGSTTTMALELKNNPWLQ